MPPGGAPLEPAPGGPTAHVFGGHGRAEAITAGAGESGWRVMVEKPDPAKPFVAQCALAFPAAGLTPGDVILVIFQARRTDGEKGVIQAKLQNSEPPYPEAAKTTAFDITADWAEYPALFTVETAVPSGKAALTLFCGGVAQSLEIRAIRASRYPQGTDTRSFPRVRRTYDGRAPDAPWRTAALERIERLRKRDLSLQAVDANGRPLAGARMDLVLKRHEFGFGSAVPADWIVSDSDDGKQFRAVVDRLFSMVVFENDLKDFWWGKDQKPHEKQARLARLEQAMQWLSERRIAIRGHYLMQIAVPPNLSRWDAAAIRSHFLDTTRERIAFVRGRVCQWDVINHPVAWGGAELLTRRPGLESIDLEVFRLARELTGTPMYVNEDQIFRPGPQSDGTWEYLRHLKQLGLPADGLGNQAHIHESHLPSPEHVLRVTDHFAEVVPSQIITEFDVATENDEELAADYTRDLLIACFSHPAYNGFLLWGFWEGSHWIPSAASWNKDWSIRPRGRVWEEWVGKRWRTTVSVETDSQGIARWRGFPGLYEARPSGAPSDAPSILFPTSKDTSPARLPVP